jgi:sugar phosphate isomerase/epimerase
MCYGFDGERALQQSLAARGIDRRGFLRHALTGAAAVGVAATGLAPVAARAGSGLAHVPPGLISIQLYTVRDALSGSPGFDEMLRRIADFGYPRVEMAGYYGRTAAQLRTFFDDLGIRATSSHDGIAGSPAQLETKIQNALTLGQSYMVVPYLYSEKLSDWQRYADQMNNEAAQARAAGLRYGYHNHAHEFTIDLGGGKRPWDVITSEFDPDLVHLETDLYWVVTGGINSGDGVKDPEAFTIDVIRNAPQRVLQYHVKDRDPATGDMADLGTGMIDFARIFDAHTPREFIMENDTPDVSPTQTAQVGYRYLRTVRF